MLYLICYDISDNSRRKKLTDVLLDFGGRVQESVFECDLKSDARLREIIRRIRKRIDPAADTVRIYRICAACCLESQVVGLDCAPPPIPRVLIL